MTLLHAVAVRPYDERIRLRVVSLLERVGCVVDAEDVVSSGTPDEAALRFVLARPHRVLLVPFHAHRSPIGASLDGLGFVRRLHDAAPKRVFRVLMPVSRFASAAVLLARVPDHVLLLDEDTLELPLTEARVHAHLHGGG